MKIHLAGFETIYNSYSFTPKEDANLFLSFYYQKNSQKTLDTMPKQNRKIIIDSGAHSFFEQIGVSVTSKDFGKSKGIKNDPQHFFDRYFEFIKQNYNKVDYFVELDIQEIVGRDKVNQWRKKLKQEGLFNKIITVHHTCDSEKDFDEILDTTESKYIGLEGLRQRKIVLDYGVLIKKCYEKGIKVHGFAMTDFRLIYKYPFYSVDSSTWTNVVRFGHCVIFDQTKGVRQVVTDKRNMFKHNIDMELHNSKRERENVYSKFEQSSLAYKQAQDYITNVWEARGIKWD